MSKIRSFMIKHPLISILIIFPFSFLMSVSLFDIILNLFLPFLFAFWGSTWIYKTIIGTLWNKSLNKPFWFI